MFSDKGQVECFEIIEYAMVKQYPVAMWIFFRFIYLQTSDLILNILPICDK